MQKIKISRSTHKNFGDKIGVILHTFFHILTYLCRKEIIKKIPEYDT